MSRRTAEIAGEAADALAGHDFDRWLSLHSEDCEFVPLIVGVEGGEPYRGHDGCRAFWADIHGAFADWRSDVEDVRDHGDGAVLTLRLRGRGRDSGLPVDRRVWQAFKTRDGKAVWWCIYGSEQEALDAL
jgi:ketosteroid isomerase-like protein